MMLHTLLSPACSRKPDQPDPLRTELREYTRFELYDNEMSVCRVLFTSVRVLSLRLRLDAQSIACLDESASLLFYIGRHRLQGGPCHLRRTAQRKGLIAVRKERACILLHARVQGRSARQTSVNISHHR
jgi:hypothetical protein